MHLRFSIWHLSRQEPRTPNSAYITYTWQSRVRAIPVADRLTAYLLASLVRYATSELDGGLGIEFEFHGGFCVWIVLFFWDRLGAKS